MRHLKNLGVILIALVAVSAIAATAASASNFTYSEEGELTSEATTNQVFTAGGEVVCKTAAGVGPIGGFEFEEQELEVAYSECKAYGVATVHTTPAQLLLTADRTVHLLNTITITITKTLLTNHCTITVTPQTVAGGVDFINTEGHIDVVKTETGLAYHSTGSPCPAAGTYTDGTYTGSSILKRSAGGAISWDE